MGTIGRIKKYKAFFVDKAGNNIDYTTFIYSDSYDDAMDRAKNLMNDMEDDSLVKANVVLITNQGSNWAGVYR
jgi:hypothetical protein